MTNVEKTVRKHLNKAKKAYARHLADKHSLNGPYLIGRQQAIYELGKELGVFREETKTDKAGR